MAKRFCGSCFAESSGGLQAWRLEGGLRRSPKRTLSLEMHDYNMNAIELPMLSCLKPLIRESTHVQLGFAFRHEDVDQQATNAA